MSPLQILEQYWGYRQFRPQQAEIIDAAIAGQDVLALLPTGGGKSICFQVPGLSRDGLCLVVSPLIALMKDQVYQLQKRGISAVALHAGMRFNDVDRILDNCVQGGYKFLYLSPERLQSELFLERFNRMKVGIIAIDEAHCVSQWGYDFRPPYLEIAKLREIKPEVPFIAVTATATQSVVADIQEKLAFNSGKKVFKGSFLRDNISYSVKYGEGKMAAMLDILAKVKGSGIVYVRNRRQTKEIADFLARRGISADFYHAGLEHDERMKKQEGWINNQSRVMVATNAFGMGIDKPDVRIVVHIELPDNLEAYFQEAGRAGRDGKKAFAVLLYGPNDKTTLEEQFEQSYPEIKFVKQVYQALGSLYQLATGSGEFETYPFDLGVFAKSYQFSPILTLAALKQLQQAGWISLSDSVYQSSTLQITATKEQLYDLMLKEPKVEPLLKTILRSNQGVFQSKVNLNEGKLASHLRISLDDLRQQLSRLDKMGTLTFEPTSESPKLTFTRPRVGMENLALDTKLLAFLKDRHQRRMLSAIAFAEDTLTCRTQLLIDYFGEKETVRCGICDNCLGRHKPKSDADVGKMADSIKAKLTAQPMPIEQLCKSYPGGDEQSVLDFVGFAVEEGWIKYDGKSGLLSWNY